MPYWKKHIAICTLVFFLFANLPKNWTHDCPNHHEELSEISASSEYIKSDCTACDFQLFFQESGIVFSIIFFFFPFIISWAKIILPVSHPAFWPDKYRAPPISF